MGSLIKVTQGIVVEKKQTSQLWRARACLCAWARVLGKASSPCQPYGLGRYHQMALWHSFPTPFSSCASECSVLERKVTLVLMVGFGVQDEGLKRWLGDGERRQQRPVPEAQCWGQEAPRPLKAGVPLHCASTPLFQRGISEQGTHLNQLQLLLHPLLMKEVGNLLGTCHQLAEEWFW